MVPCLACNTDHAQAGEQAPLVGGLDFILRHFECHAPRILFMDRQEGRTMGVRDFFRYLPGVDANLRYLRQLRRDGVYANQAWTPQVCPCRWP